ncbi:MAG: ribonuclease HII, partial [Myxococcota bacterium]
MSSSDDSQWDLAASPLLGVVRPYVIGEVEAWARRRGIDPLVGVDEVGKGALAGPVVAAAVALPPDHGLDRHNDSKQLTAADRQALVPQIEAIALAFGVGTV